MLSCVDDPHANYEPSRTERINHVLFQYFMIFLYLVFSSFILGYRYQEPFVLGGVGAFIVMVLIWVILKVFNLPYHFNWWRQTYAISFFITGSYIVMFSCISSFIFEKVENIQGIYSMMMGSFISVMIIVLELLIIIKCKKYHFINVYNMGYSSTFSDPDLKRYLSGRFLISVEQSPLSEIQPETEV